MRLPNYMTPLNRATTAQSRLSKMKGEIQQLTDAAVSGISVQAPSDAPGQWHGILDLQAGVDHQAVYKDNADMAKSMLALADTTLGEANDVMDRAREIAVMMSNDTYNDTDRATAALEVDALREEIIELANTDFGGRYLFAGTAYDAPPYDPTGAYTGTADVPETVAGRDLRVQTGYDGAAIFTDALTVLDTLATAMRSGPGSTDATRATLPDIDVAQQVLVTSRADVGYEFNTAEDAFSLAENLEFNLQSALDTKIAADPIETYTRLAEVQGAYQAALQVTAQSGNNSLFDFLR